MARREKGFEPCLFGLAKVGHVVEAGAAAEQRAEGKDQHIDQVVIRAAWDTRVRQVLEMFDQAELWMRLHPHSSEHYRQKYKRQNGPLASCAQCHTVCRTPSRFDAFALGNLQVLCLPGESPGIHAGRISCTGRAQFRGSLREYLGGKPLPVGAREPISTIAWSCRSNHGLISKAVPQMTGWHSRPIFLRGKA